MKSLKNALLLLIFAILALQQTHAFFFKDPTKLWAKLLKIDMPAEPLPKEENFFTVFKDTKEKLFKEIPNTFKSIINKFEDKFEHKVDKMEKEKEEFDEKIMKFFKEKNHLFKDLIEEKIEKIEEEFEDKKVIKKPVVKDPYYKPAPKPDVYKPKPKIPKKPPPPPPPKYAPHSVEVEVPESEEVYVKPKIIKVPPKYLPESAEVYAKPKVLPKYLPESAEEVPESEEAYVKPPPAAYPGYPCSEEYIPEPRLVRLKTKNVPENIYYFT